MVGALFQRIIRGMTRALTGLGQLYCRVYEYPSGRGPSGTRA